MYNEKASYDHLLMTSPELDELRARRASHVRTIKRIIGQALSEKRAMRPAEETDFEGLRAKVDAIDRTAKRFHDLAVDGDGSSTFMRCIRAIAAGGNSRQAAADFALDTLRDPILERALGASTGASGGFAVPTPLATEVIELLRVRTAVRRLGAVSVPMPNGNMTWAKLTGAITVQYQGENASIVKTEQALGSLRVSAKKLTALVPISNDLLRFANPAADSIVLTDIAAAMAAVEDLAFIRGDGTAFSPRGLKNWASAGNLIAANGTVSLANTDADLGKLELALENANCRMISPGWIFAPRIANYLKNLRGTGGDKAYPEMDLGMLRGKPYVATTAVPTNLGAGTESEVYLADFADCLIAEDSLALSLASKGGDYVENSVLVSAYANDQSVVRVVASQDFAMRHAESVAILSGVTWA